MVVTHVVLKVDLQLLDLLHRRCRLVCLYVIYLFEQVEVLAANQLMWTCYTHGHEHVIWVGQRLDKRDPQNVTVCGVGRSSACFLDFLL